MNQLGDIELLNNDKSSWPCKDDKGGVQLLLWNFTPKQAADSVKNQIYFKQDLPPESMSDVEIRIGQLPEKEYFLQIYKVGYHVNDAYSTYLDLGPARSGHHQPD